MFAIACVIAALFLGIGARLAGEHLSKRLIAFFGKPFGGKVDL